MLNWQATAMTHMIHGVYSFTSGQGKMILYNIGLATSGHFTRSRSVQHKGIRSSWLSADMDHQRSITFREFFLVIFSKVLTRQLWVFFFFLVLFFQVSHPLLCSPLFVIGPWPEIMSHIIYPGSHLFIFCPPPLQWPFCALKFHHLADLMTRLPC